MIRLWHWGGTGVAFAVAGDDALAQGKNALSRGGMNQVILTCTAMQ